MKFMTRPPIDKHTQNTRPKNARTSHRPRGPRPGGGRPAPRPRAPSRRRARPPVRFYLFVCKMICNCADALNHPFSHHTHMINHNTTPTAPTKSFKNCGRLPPPSPPPPFPPPAPAPPRPPPLNPLPLPAITAISWPETTCWFCLLWWLFIVGGFSVCCVVWCCC